jgi:hypothetical protein
VADSGGAWGIPYAARPAKSTATLKTAPWERTQPRHNVAGMTTPLTTELPLHLEPTTADPFLGRSPIDDFDVSPATELHSRRSDGIDVRLLWYRSRDRLVVAVSDAVTGDAFELAVPPAQALDAFHHPYAHAAARGIPYRSAPPGR